MARRARIDANAAVAAAAPAACVRGGILKRNKLEAGRDEDRALHLW
jgi:hypothetical protein